MLYGLYNLSPLARDCKIPYNTATHVVNITNQLYKINMSGRSVCNVYNMSSHVVWDFTILSGRQEIVKPIQQGRECCK
ncbi:hypothetical protein AC249_AIPGENE14781 [Exaiptasia diaphana]|nr:hypothetical protein AC249_AIPGENE14781 [Exaiptasia diaphana]